MHPDSDLFRQLKEAARDLLLSGVSLRHASMDRLARHLRISKKTVYQHVRSKEQLLAALLSDHLAQARALYKRVRRERSATTGLEQLVDWLPTQFTPVSLALQAQMRVQFPDLWEPFGEAYYQQLRQALADCLSRGMVEGTFRPGLDVEVLVRLLLGHLNLLASGQLFPAGQFDPAYVCQQIIQHFRRGVYQLPSPMQ